MRVKIIPGCIACGICEGICEAVFTVDDDCVADNCKVPGNEEECRFAAQECPVEVIILEEDEETGSSGK